MVMASSGSENETCERALAKAKPTSGYSAPSHLICRLHQTARIVHAFVGSIGRPFVGIRRCSLANICNGREAHQRARSRARQRLVFGSDLRGTDWFTRRGGGEDDAPAA